MNNRLFVFCCIVLSQIHFSSLLFAADKPKTEPGQGLLDTIILQEVNFKQSPLDVTLKSLEESSKRCDPTGQRGVKFCLRLGPEVRTLPLVSFSATNVPMRTALESIVTKAGLCYEYKEYPPNKMSPVPERVVAIGSKKHAKRLLPKGDPAFINAESQFSFEVFAIPLKQSSAIEAVLPVLNEKESRLENYQTPEYRAAMTRAVTAFSKIVQGRKLVKAKKGWYPNSKESIEREPENATPSNPETFLAQILPEADPITERCSGYVQVMVWLSREKRKSFEEKMECFQFVTYLQKNESVIALAKPTDDKLNAYVTKITYMGFRVKK